MKFPTFTHVTNQNDPVPTLPPEVLGFQHPSGEVHITKVSGTTASAISCPGQENKVCELELDWIGKPRMTDDTYCLLLLLSLGLHLKECSDGNSLFQASVQDHLGPYFSGISFGETQCS